LKKLRILEESKLTNTIVGIVSKNLGAGTFLTSVEEIQYSDDEPIVILKNYDYSGCFLVNNVLPLSTIESIIPFKTILGNPFLREVEKQLAHKRLHHENNSLKAPDYLY
jgi:hypothetical protein